MRVPLHQTVLRMRVISIFEDPYVLYPHLEGLLHNPGMRVLLLFALGLSAIGQQPSIVGRWRSLTTSEGGIGALFEFHADGVVDYSPGAVVESDYRVDGDELILPSGTKDGPEQRQVIEWLGEDHFRLKADGAAGDELSRSGTRADPKRPIVGEWTGTREMAGQQVDIRWFFYANGKTLLLVPFVTQHGRYTINKQIIRVELPGRGAVEGKFAVQGDLLTLPGPHGTGESKFARY